jgi:hypothetical protein
LIQFPAVPKQNQAPLKIEKNILKAQKQRSGIKLIEKENARDYN